MSNLRHFLDIDQFDSTTLRSILDQGSRFKNKMVKNTHLFKGKTLVLIFEKLYRGIMQIFENYNFFYPQIDIHFTS